MNTDFKASIDERIRKLKLLRELADDPEAIKLLRELLDSMVNGAESATAKPKQFSLRPPRTGRKHGELLRRVEATLKAFSDPATTADLVEKMIADGFLFTSKNPRVSVNEALGTLQKANKAILERTEGVTNYWRAKRDLM